MKKTGIYGIIEAAAKNSEKEINDYILDITLRRDKQRNKTRVNSLFQEKVCRRVVTDARRLPGGVCCNTNHTNTTSA